MILNKIESPDKNDEFLCNICLEKVSVADGIFVDEITNNHICNVCKEENDL